MAIGASGPAASTVPATAQAGYAGSGIQSARLAHGQSESGRPVPPGGLGHQLAGGLATGVGVGAGIMAAEAIGRSLWGRESAAVSATGARVDPVLKPPTDDQAIDPEMGGRDFGIDDATSWDDGSGGGWDS